MIWTHNICRACWDVREGDREPVTVRDPEETTCCVCGEKNRDGIYFRCDPAFVFHCHCEES